LEGRRIREMTQPKTSLQHTIRDVENDGMQECIIDCTSVSIELGFTGYPQAGMEDSAARPVAIERDDGVLRVLVWADKDDEAPTHIIQLPTDA